MPDGTNLLIKIKWKEDGILGKSASISSIILVQLLALIMSAVV